MNPKVAQTIYQIGTVVTGLLGVALIWGGIDSHTADAVNSIVAGLGTLLGGTLPSATAAVRTNRQIKDGTLGSPADQIINGITTIAAVKTQAEADIARVTKTAQDVLGVIPGGAALADDIQRAATALGGYPLPSTSTTS